MTKLWWPCAGLVFLYLAAVFFRPILPIDETRYMTVAWEMYLSKGWLSPLTMNFEAYHHKPPMLFWLINLFWSVFGINRWSALIPIALASLSAVYLTITLGKKILPAEKFDANRIAMITMGSVPFLIYSTLVMFDVTLTCFVLLSLICLLEYSVKRKTRYMILMGLLLGLGVLTKGPVAYLYVIFPMLLAPYWITDFKKPLAWYGDCVAALIISILPVLIWLLPVLNGADNQFAFWLVWEQTAGRVTGSFNAAHVRPFYFYAPLIPAMLLPWIAFPSFWRNTKSITLAAPEIRFLASWVIPTVLCFCLISGKQPHYLLPLLPAAVLLVSLLLQSVPTKNMMNVMIVMISLLFTGQAIASQTFFKSYDLSPVARIVEEHKEQDLAFVRNYHGELGYLAKLEKSVADVQPDAIREWFINHPNGLAVIRYKKEEDVSDMRKLISAPYRGKNIGVFSNSNP